MNTAVIADVNFIKGGDVCVYVSHDNEDGIWQFLAPDFDGDESRGLVVSLSTAIENDPSLSELHDLPLGWYAVRKSKSDKWERHRANK